MEAILCLLFFTTGVSAAVTSCCSISRCVCAKKSFGSTSAFFLGGVFLSSMLSTNSSSLRLDTPGYGSSEANSIGSIRTGTNSAVTRREGTDCLLSKLNVEICSGRRSSGSSAFEELLIV